MKLKSKALITVFTWTIHLVLAQNLNEEKYNTVNSSGKKDGIWIQYLDSLIYPTSKSKAKYFRYVSYHNGSISKDFIKGLSKRWQRVIPETGTQTDSVLPLNGKLIFLRKAKLFDKRTQRIVETYHQGHPVLFEQYYDDKLYEYLDFKKQYNAIPGTFYFWSGFDGSYQGYYRDGPKGWTFYEEKT